MCGIYADFYSEPAQVNIKGCGQLRLSDGCRHEHPVFSVSSIILLLPTNQIRLAAFLVAFVVAITQKP